MNLPFTSEQFFDVFRRYNEAVAPLQMVLVIGGLVVALLAWAREHDWSRVILLSLAALWLWMGVVYHFVFFRPINPAATVFAILFVAQGAILLFAALRKSVRFAGVMDLAGITGIVLIVYALAVYPTIGYFAGHRYPYNPTFGLPCPTTIFTIGVLLWARPVRAYLFVLPWLWSIIGFSAALKLGVYEDGGLPMAGLASLLLSLQSSRQAARQAQQA